nr:MAG: late protein 2 [Ailuropoda melanoleuca papillomavirus 5]
MRNRKRRAAPSDIYPRCKISNTCPPDIVNKYEQTTLADKILKYGSAGVFLGSLGISTGRGTGGTGGYVPLGAGSGVRVGTRVTTIRPSLPVSAVSPEGVIPIDAINPLGPSILPPEFPSIVEDLLPPPPPPRVVEEIELEPIIPARGDTSLSTNGADISTPKITTTDEAAVLEVTPETRQPRIIGRTQYSNPTFEVSITSSAGAGESSAADHIVVNGFSGGHTVGEQIPLQDLTLSSRSTYTETEETGFMTSTPSSTRPAGRTRSLYNRRVQQIQVFDKAFLGQPRSLVTFENPVYTADDVDLIFAQDVDAVAEAAPHSDFQDIVKLSRPTYEQTREGRVRVSRLGQRATMQTRSGLRIGPQAHFYYDVSDISEAIELQPLEEPVFGETSGQSVITSGSSDFEVISLDSSISLAPFSDDYLLDEIEAVADNLQLVIGERRSQPISVPQLERPFVLSISDLDGVHVIHPSGDSQDTFIPVYPTDNPKILIDVEGSGNFFLHPSLYKRKRRKRRFF